MAPVFEYGAGQPWTQRLGYDYNGDGKTGDRAPGVDRFGMDGPRYSNVNLRITKALAFSGFGAELIVEAFNLFNRVVFGTPATNLNSSSFGLITSQSNNARQMQFALKLYW